MDKQTYTADQIKKLKRNKNITRCSATTVRYNKAFKQAAIKQYNEGMSAVEIFQNADIDLGIIGKYAPNHLMHQWRASTRAKVEKKEDPLDKPHNNLEMLRSQVAYLKAENHFLAQLRAKKRKR